MMPFFDYRFAQNYSQLMEMAERGDHSAVDFVVGDSMDFKKEGESGFYQDFMDGTSGADKKTMHTLYKVTQKNKGNYLQAGHLIDLFLSNIKSNCASCIVSLLFSIVVLHFYFKICHLKIIYTLINSTILATIITSTPQNSSC